MRIQRVILLACTLACLSGVPAAAQEIDTLDYFVTKHPDKGLTGAHPLSQTIIGSRSYYVKWGGDAFEVHRIDEAAGLIYLEEDHGTGAGVYSLRPGAWLKIHMQIGETIANYGAAHTIRYYHADCTVAKENAFYYETTLEKRIPDLDLGGDLGKQDVIVVGYGLPGTGWERDYYSREWGWVMWEEYAGDKKTLKNRSVFNKVAPRIAPKAELACASKPAPGHRPRAGRSPRRLRPPRAAVRAAFITPRGGRPPSLTIAAQSSNLIAPTTSTRRP